MNPNHCYAGISRRVISPPAGVELAGLGYYLQRRWERIRDDLNATALVISAAPDRAAEAVAIVALDLMYNSDALTARIRNQVQSGAGILTHRICINVSHSHCAPTAGLIRGAGEIDESYVDWVATQAADAVVDGWQKCRPARLLRGESKLDGMTFNRTRDAGAVDTTVGILRVEEPDGTPIAAAVNFHSHCIAFMEHDLFAVSRDWPGDVVDQLESALPGTTAMYLQGVCGDVNFKREYNGTARYEEPGKAVAHAALEAWHSAKPISATGCSAALQSAVLPTREWTIDEIETVRSECEYRLRTGDVDGWLDGFGRAVVNQPERLPLRYGGSVEKAVAAICRFGMEWIGEPGASRDVAAEVQALKIGDLFIATCPGELFTSFGLALREKWQVQSPRSQLFILGYTNGSIGYIPDEHEILRDGYAAVQSPKFTGQRPFTSEAGLRLVDTMFATLKETSETKHD